MDMPEEGGRAPGTVLTGSGEPLIWLLGTELGTLNGHYILLTSEVSSHLQGFSCIYCVVDWGEAEITGGLCRCECGGVGVGTGGGFMLSGTGQYPVQDPTDFPPLIWLQEHVVILEHDLSDIIRIKETFNHQFTRDSKSTNTPRKIFCPYPAG